jgi:hypothetical protein
LHPDPVFPELIDMEADPYERNNLIGDAERARLHAMLAKAMANAIPATKPVRAP